MDPALRIVTSIPVSVLWDDTGEIVAVRESYLTRSQIKDLLRVGPFQFVVADVGTPLHWIETDASFGFWRRIVEPHLSEPDNFISLDRFPGGLAYLASLWKRQEEPPIILLEAVH